MSDDGDSLTARVAALAAVVVLAVACNGGTADDTTDPSDVAASPDPTSDPAGPESQASPSPTPTPTPTETPTGPDDEGWAEHLGLTEEELEERRASDDFLEFAEARRAREHPRFDETHGGIGLEPTSGDGLEFEEGEWVEPVSPQAVARQFLLPFRDTLLAEGVEPASEVAFTGDHMGPRVSGGYVNRIHRAEPDQRQILIAVAFYEGIDGEDRGRVAMAAADVDIIDPKKYQVDLTIVEFESHVADAAVAPDWSDTWSEEIADKVRAWGEPREFE